MRYQSICRRFLFSSMDILTLSLCAVVPYIHIQSNKEIIFLIKWITTEFMYNFAQCRILMSLGNFYPPITHHLNGKPFTISFIHIVRVFFVSHSIFVHFVTLNVVWCDDSVQFDWIRLNSIRFNFIRQNSDSLFSRFLLLNRLISSVWRNFSIIFGCMAHHVHWNWYIIVQYHVFTSKIKIQKGQENGEQPFWYLLKWYFYDSAQFEMGISKFPSKIEMIFPFHLLTHHKQFNEEEGEKNELAKKWVFEKKNWIETSNILNGLLNQ